MTRHRKDRADLIVETIADFRATYGFGPTVRELRDRVGLASTAAVHHHLLKLEREGRVTWSPHLNRTIAVVPVPPSTEPGLCARPGCGKPLPPPKRGQARQWCSPSCRTIAMHVRRWLRAADSEYLAERIGLAL